MPIFDWLQYTWTKCQLVYIEPAYTASYLTHVYCPKVYGVFIEVNTVLEIFSNENKLPSNIYRGRCFFICMMDVY